MNRINKINKISKISKIYFCALLGSKSEQILLTNFGKFVNKLQNLLTTLLTKFKIIQNYVNK